MKNIIDHRFCLHPTSVSICSYCKQLKESHKYKSRKLSTGQEKHNGITYDCLYIEPLFVQEEK